MGKKLFSEVELFLFDMDGLLFDTETIYQEKGRKLAREYGYNLSDDLIERTTGTTNNKMREEYLKEFGEDFPIDEYTDRVIEEIKLSAKNKEVELMTGVIEMLEFLKENNKPMILATSSNLEMAKLLTESKNIGDYFAHFITSEDVVNGKPDPEVFLTAASKLGVSPSRVVVFEDSLNGIRAGHSAGMISFMIPDKIKPTPEIKEKYFKEFKDLLEVIEFFKK